MVPCPCELLQHLLSSYITRHDDQVPVSLPNTATLPLTLSQHLLGQGLLLPCQSLISATSLCASTSPSVLLSYSMFLLNLQDSSSTGSFPSDYIHVQVPLILKQALKLKHPSLFSCPLNRLTHVCYVHLFTSHLFSDH